MDRPPSENLHDPWLRTDEPLFWLLGGAHEVRTNDSYYFDSRKRTDRLHVVVQFTLAGTGFYQDRRGRTLLPAGWAFVSIIPGDFEYGYAPHTYQPYELVFMSIDGPDAVRWYERITQSFGHVLNLGTEGRLGQMMLALVHARETRRLPDRYVQSGQVYQVFMEILSTLNRTRLSTSPRVTQAMQLITEHVDHADFGINQLADKMDCSREHLTRLFRSAIGVSRHPGPLADHSRADRSRRPAR